VGHRAGLDGAGNDEDFSEIEILGMLFVLQQINPVLN
jgi:hypothetical protein